MPIQARTGNHHLEEGSCFSQLEALESIGPLGVAPEWLGQLSGKVQRKVLEGFRGCGLLGIAWAFLTPRVPGLSTFWEDHFSGKQQVVDAFWPITQEVSHNQSPGR